MAVAPPVAKTPIAIRFNARLLYRIRRDAMRMREPTDQGFERLARRGAVEGHQGGRDAGGADEAGSPAPPQRGCDFDDVASAADGFFEAVGGRGDWSWLHRSGANSGILMGRPDHSSEGECESRVHRLPRRQTLAKSVQKKVPSTGDPRDVHRSSTAFPQGPVGSARQRSVERVRERRGGAVEPEGAP